MTQVDHIDKVIESVLHSSCCVRQRGVGITERLEMLRGYVGKIILLDNVDGKVVGAVELPTGEQYSITETSATSDILGRLSVGQQITFDLQNFSDPNVYRISHINGKTPINSIMDTQTNIAAEQMTPWASITTCYRKIGVFEGRASRAEFWWFHAFITIIYIITSLIPRSTPSLLITLVFFLSAILPMVSVQVRRLHDTGRSGWNYFWLIIPIIGIIPFLIFNCEKGTDGANKYGKSPNNNQREDSLIAGATPNEQSTDQMTASKHTITKNSIDQIHDLKNLLDSGAITEEEFVSMKKAILG